MNPAEPVRILLLEDSQSDAFLVRMAVQRSGHKYELVHVTTLAAAQDALKHDGPFHVLLADLNLPDSAAPNTLDFLTSAAHQMSTIALNSCDDVATQDRCAADTVGCFSKQHLLDPEFLQVLEEEIARFEANFGAVR